MQSRTQSHIESACNIATGFIISYSVWRWGVKPAIEFGALSMSDNFYITCIFTISSYIRTFVWRRIFNSKERVQIK